MSRRLRRLLVLAAALALLVTVTGTGALSSAELSRGVDVEVAEDANAYFAIERPDDAVGAASAEVENASAVLELGNNFAEDLTVTASVADERVEVVTEEVTLGPGDGAPLVVRTTCEGGDVEVTVHVVAESADGGVRIELERDVTVECPTSTGTANAPSRLTTTAASVLEPVGRVPARGVVL